MAVGNQPQAVLRPLDPSDAPALVALEKHWQFQPQIEEYIGDTSSLDQAGRFIAEHVQPHAHLLGIWVGSSLAGLVVLKRPAVHIASLDYLLDQRYRSQGLMTRACAAVLTHLFTNLHAHRAEIQCDIANIKSCAVAERLGFHREGLRRHAACYGNHYGDIALYGLLATEWKAPEDFLQWEKDE